MCGKMDTILKYLNEINKTEYVTVACGIITKLGNNNEQLLLLIRRAEDDKYPLHFEAPRGRCENKDKNLINCLKREIKEETNLDVEVIRYIDKFICTSENRKSFQYNYLCRMINPKQEVKLSNEHDEYRWITSLGEAELLVMPELRNTISKVFNIDKTIVNYQDNNVLNKKIREYGDR